MNHSIQTMCAVLICTPVNNKEFTIAANPSFHSDYVSGILSRNNNVAQAWEEYAPVADAAQSLIATASSLGVYTRTQANLRDFANATARYHYVVLLAHWRGAMIRPSDLVGPVPTIVARMREDPCLKVIKPKSLDLPGLVDSLNEAIVTRVLLDAFSSVTAEQGRRSAAIGYTLCRDLVDEALGELIAPGNRVEMTDGLHTLAAMEEALAERFDGELDFAMCTSAALGRYIDIRRRAPIEHLHWPIEVLPQPQLLKIERTLQQMAKTGKKYIETRLSIEEAELAIGRR